jgi:hypothetical protein
VSYWLIYVFSEWVTIQLLDKIYSLKENVEIQIFIWAFCKEDCFKDIEVRNELGLTQLLYSLFTKRVKRER